MKIYTVIPITKGVGKESLTYFSKNDIEIGSLVSIPLRQKNVPALVIDYANIEQAKINLKSANYSLKKITSVRGKLLIDEPFIQAVKDIARWHASVTGVVLNSLLPKIVLEENKLLSVNTAFKTRPNNHERFLLQEDDVERFSHYKAFIRSEFAKKQSVFFCVPTKEDSLKAKEILEKGIENYTVILSTDMPKKSFRDAVKKIKTDNHPLLIIATIPFLSIRRDDVGTIILERENSRSYRTQKKPYIDLKIFAETLAKRRGLKFLAGDIMLSVETIWRRKKDEFIDFIPLKFRSLSSAECQLVDMKGKDGNFESSFKIFSPELISKIKQLKEENEKMFVFSARKGLFPSTVCGDCGQVVLCKNCQTPVVLYGKSNNRKENFFICNKCGNKENTEWKCGNCQSWKLKTLGIGIELVEKEIKENFPEINLFVINKDRTSTSKKAYDTIRKFKETPGSILIGTEMALFYLNDSIDHVCVSSIDSLLAVPDFRIREKILYLLIKMRSLAQKTFIIQTRNSSEKIFDNALKGNLIDFYKDELEMRKQFNYPPLSIFIKLSFEGNFASIQKTIELVEKELKNYNINIFEKMDSDEKRKKIVHAVVRISRESWPDEDLLKILKNLPVFISIKVDPESLL